MRGYGRSRDRGSYPDERLLRYRARDGRRHRPFFRPLLGGNAFPRDRIRTVGLDLRQRERGRCGNLPGTQERSGLRHQDLTILYRNVSTFVVVQITYA